MRLGVSWNGAKEVRSPSAPADAREGLSWNLVKGGFAIFSALALIASLVSFSAPPAAASGTARVIVVEAPDAGDAPENFIEMVGGTVDLPLGLINGFVADVPFSALDRLSARHDVVSVTLDGRLESQAKKPRLSDGDDEGATLESVTKAVHAHNLWHNGYTGSGIGIALIDTGVVPVDGLQTPGKLYYGPDLSFESQSDAFRNLDTNGHGTHLAGIMAGRENAASKINGTSGGRYFLGVAPDSHLLSMKVGTADGAADVSQVIAAIDWVVQHRNDNGMNIRVINLAFGTDGTQSYLTDPLAFAVEAAWRNGVVVVVAAGNDGNASQLRNPATDPFVIAVGAVDNNNSSKLEDDTLAPYSNCGTTSRSVDVVAPGTSIVSLRNPGSNADLENPDSRVSEALFRGSGTSQAAAVVTGAAALLLQQRPELNPDQVKALLMQSASDLPEVQGLCEGAGMIDLEAASNMAIPYVSQNASFGTGTGSLEAARGSHHVADAGGVLTGEQDIFGAEWDGEEWAPTSLAGNSWSGGVWNGNSWSGNSWSGNSWSANSWSANSWSGNSWSANSWSANSWSGNSWSGNSWSGNSWSANSWSGNSWSANSWSANYWS